MAETSHLGLFVTDAADDPTFKEWREKMSASGSSNMEKIDRAVLDLDSRADDADAHAQDSIIHVTDAEKEAWNSKQEAIEGSENQCWGFDANGNAVAREMPGAIIREW